MVRRSAEAVDRNMKGSLSVEVIVDTGLENGLYEPETMRQLDAFSANIAQYKGGDNGVYVVVGQYTDNGPVEINPHLDINRKHVDIRGCWGCDFSHLYRAIGMMSRHCETIGWEKMISARYGLAQAGRALEDVEQLRVVKAVIDPKQTA